MKWTFAALVLLNIGLLMWASWYREEGDEPGRGPRPPVNAEKMVPLLTPGVVLQPRPAGVARPEPLIAVEREAAAPIPIPVEKSCQAIGPFETRAQAARAGAKLETLGLAYVVRPVEERIESGYWVFLPPLATRAEAEEKLKELSARGIKDHYLVREAGMVNAISLGVFAQRRNAERRRQELAVKGIQANLAPHPRTRTVYRLNLRAGELSVEQQEALNRTEWDVPGARLQPGDCGEEPSESPAGRSGKSAEKKR